MAENIIRLSLPHDYHMIFTINANKYLNYISSTKVS